MNSTQQSIRFAKKPVSRKRATKACLKCRKRKVRCDVTRTSTPCTNCRLDGCECVVARRADAFPVPDRRASVASNAELLRDCDAVTAEASATSPSSSHDPTSPVDDASSVLHTLEESEYTTSVEHVDRADIESPTADVIEDVFEEIPEILPYIPPPIEEPSEPVRSELKALYSSMPFLRTLNMRDCDFNHLNAQGCLRVPSKPILDEFIRHYFLYIHPLLPLLNEADFWNAYDPKPNTATPGTPVSMLLLQSMMFAACTFVSKESLRTLGYSTILQAKESFYTKAKLLYDFSTDPDPVSISQAALLLTYWCPTFRSGPRMPNSRWLRIAIQHAKSIEADQYDSPSYGLHISQQDIKRRNILKRIWWCCIIRDRIMPLCVRRNIQITSARFDFVSNSPLGYDDLVDELESSRVYNIATKHKLILTLERLTALCVTLTDILGLVYPTETLPILDGEAHSTAYTQVQEHKKSLRNWAVATRPPLALQDLSVTSGGFEDSAVLFTNLVWIYFHASQVAVCNYELHLGLVLGLVTQNPTSSQETQFLKNNRRDLRSATKCIAECFARLHPHRLTRWLPSSAVACTALPLAMHMVDIKMSSASSPAEIWSRPEVASKQSRLNVLIQVFRELHPKYDGVHSISKTIRYFMSQLNEPAQMMLTNEHADVLARSPAQYLRLALTIDVCLSQDRLARDTDFPDALRRFIHRNQNLMPMLLGQPQFRTPRPMTRQIALPRPLSPTTYAKSFSRWMEDDPSVGFALQMGIDIGHPQSVVYEVTERAQKANSDSAEETSPVSEESQASGSQVSESVAGPETTEDLLQRLQGAASWAQNDQSLYFAQEMGLLSDGIGFNQGYIFPFLSENDLGIRWADKIPGADKPSYMLLMALCAVSAQSLTLKAVFDSSLLGDDAPHNSETYFTEATSRIPAHVPGSHDLDYLRSYGLLALYSLRSGNKRDLHRYLGLCHGWIAEHGFHQENHWDNSISLLDVDDRRRLFWCVYRLEIHSACVLGHIIRLPEAQVSVLYPRITPTMKRETQVWTAGWDYITDLFRLMEYAILNLRQRKPQRDVVAAFYNRAPPTSILDSLAQVKADKPFILRVLSQSQAHNDFQSNRCKFMAVQITCTEALVNIMGLLHCQAPVDEVIKVAEEFLNEVTEASLIMFKVASSQIIHQLLGVGHMVYNAFLYDENHSQFAVGRLVSYLEDIVKNLEQDIPTAADAREQLRRLSQCIS
ncbi:hypothetical protein F53441_9542 [Fusarium austroafricanum]|uniref:Zn(2)-C6 fungal-type domain-containing protein n=1 Tax=Fusarium austroafricanum TaxID=2364996 RepID=A0A8H4NVD9_9HYPO|nr:hypothetical protein F53441_9542 [Fusarium austroafricanum]